MRRQLRVVAPLAELLAEIVRRTIMAGLKLVKRARIEAPTSKVHTLAGLRANNGDVLFTGPVLRVLQQVRSELCLFRL